MAGVTVSSDSEFLVRFLLDELSSEEAAVVERALFEQPGLAGSIRIAEEELIRDELAGGLSAARRDRFHSHFLRDPGRRFRYQTTQALRAALGPPQARRASAAPRSGRWLLAIAAALFLTVAADDFRRMVSGGRIVDATLFPGAVRGPGFRPKGVTIGPGTLIVRIALQIDQPQPGSRYRLVLATAEEQREVAAFDLSAPDSGNGRQIAVEVPASILEQRTYILTLTRSHPRPEELIDTFSFDVIRLR